MKRESNTKSITVGEFACDENGDLRHSCGRKIELTDCQACGSEWCFGYYCSKCGVDSPFECEAAA